MMKSRYVLLAGLLPFLFLSCKSTKQQSSSEIEKNQFCEEDICIQSEEENPERFIYKHVIIVGIDGAGAFEAKCNTPNMDSIFAKGIWTPNCIASIPPISAQCWGSMMTGVKPALHQLNNDRVESGIEYDNPVYPTIFKLARETNPDAKLAAFAGWTPIYTGIIEKNIGVITDTGNDEEIADKACDFIKAEKPDLMFVYFESADQKGHSLGFGKKEYLEALEKIDGYVGKVYDAVSEAGMLDDTLFIVTADHGGAGSGHGGILPSEMHVYFGAVGKTVNKSTRLKFKGRDLASVVCHAMNLKTNGNWASEVPKKFFIE